MNAVSNNRNESLYHGHKKTDENDDYAFLDEDELMEDEDVMVSNGNSVSEAIPSRWGNRSKRDSESDQEEEIRSDLHVIYKRRDTYVDHNNDYRKNMHFLFSVLIHEADPWSRPEWSLFPYVRPHFSKSFKTKQFQVRIY